jgi:hypothetical protein
MKELNDEQKNIVDDILYKKKKSPTRSLHIFLIGGARIGKNVYIINVHHTKHVTILY